MMTDKGLYAALRNLGLVCRKTADGDYRVNYRTEDGGTEATAYYTNDRADAFETGMAMSGSVPAPQPHLANHDFGGAGL